MKYIVYKDPKNDYEKVVERYCLRALFTSTVEKPSHTEICFSGKRK